MKKSIILFVISAFIGLGAGYLVFDVIMGKESKSTASESTETKTEETAATKETAKESKNETTTVSAETEILSQKGCLGCHSVSALDLSGGATGPDLSQAFNNVEGKHGKPINEFLKEPTSAVMAGVIGGSPLSDDEISKIVGLLQEASQK